MTIGIIGAMDEEIALLKESMTIDSEETVANCIFIKGKMAKQHVVLLKSGIGKVNAAMATSILHERYQPSAIINTGSAGGFAPDLDVGDIVIGNEVVHHDVDVTAFQYDYGQVPGLPKSFAADRELITLVENSIANFNQVKSKQGVIATGDAFMQDPNRVAFVRSKFPSLIAVEMEAAAIAQVCHQYQTPFVIIRALSDIAGKESSVSFDKFLTQAAKHAAELIIEVVSKF
ncbi:adenosylhomocysteine nucleosidase [Natronobacillus azotifigens]|uniref:5'-methylthioadenosine/S-adenosylhomocysteine nucleosidase n=1 Tax=Natronobacillus azotifigens TaxID=472978 RepID=A0A9J6RAQ1_9BACI|nr:5'-methylthioadenosine/S-adenosylhomocysteine nucleosidase [Natronobacillus azotifigens]